MERQRDLKGLKDQGCLYCEGAENQIQFAHRDDCQQGDSISKQQPLFSRIFERKGELATGQKRFRLDGSTLDFLRVGIITARGKGKRQRLGRNG